MRIITQTEREREREKRERETEREREREDSGKIYLHWLLRNRIYGETVVDASAVKE